MASVIRGNDNFDSAGGAAMKAWVNFDGTFGTNPFTLANGGIRAAYNVDSVTDNATGDYTVNFTSGALPDGKYAVVSSAARNNSTDPMICAPKGNAGTYSASAVRLQALSDGGANEDSPVVSIAIFR